MKEEIHVTEPDAVLLPAEGELESRKKCDEQ